MKKNTEDLIQHLSSDLRPVRPIQFGWRNYLKVLAVGLLCIFGVVIVMGLRTDFMEKLNSPVYLLESLIIISLAFISILTAFSLSVPSTQNKKLRHFPLFVFGSLVLISTISFFKTSTPFFYFGHGFACPLQILLMSLFPAMILFVSIKKAAVLDRRLGGFSVLTAATFLGLLSVQVTCPIETASHILLEHIFPVMILIAFGVWISERILKKI